MFSLPRVPPWLLMSKHQDHEGRLMMICGYGLHVWSHSRIERLGCDKYNWSYIISRSFHIVTVVHSTLKVIGVAVCVLLLILRDTLN